MTPRKILHATIALCIASCLLPAAVLAQSSITGVAMDASGGVLPGVTRGSHEPGPDRGRANRCHG